MNVDYTCPGCEKVHSLSVNIDEQPYHCECWTPIRESNPDIGSPRSIFYLMPHLHG